MNPTEASSPAPTGLHELSMRLLARIPAAFVRVDPHEADDLDGSDHLWLSVVESESSCGDLLAVGPRSGALWSVEHDLAHKYGGWPTLWSVYGTGEEVLAGVASYLADRLSNDVEK